MTFKFSWSKTKGSVAKNVIKQFEKEYFVYVLYLQTTKGQIKQKADWRAVDSDKKWMNEFVFVALKSK